MRNGCGPDGMGDALAPPAAAVLDSLGIAYKLLRYTPDPIDQSARRMAEILAADPGMIFKTLVLKGDKTGCFVCVLPGDAAMDRKKVLAVSGNGHWSMVPSERLPEVTGYVRGGCSPLGMKEHFPTYIDSSMDRHPEIIVNAGRQGYLLMLPPVSLVRACRAQVADLTVRQPAPAPGNS